MAAGREGFWAPLLDGSPRRRAGVVAAAALAVLAVFVALGPCMPATTTAGSTTTTTTTATTAPGDDAPESTTVPDGGGTTTSAPAGDTATTSSTAPPGAPTPTTVVPEPLGQLLLDAELAFPGLTPTATHGDHDAAGAESLSSPGWAEAARAAGLQRSSTRAYQGTDGEAGVTWGNSVQEFATPAGAADFLAALSRPERIIRMTEGARGIRVEAVDTPGGGCVRMTVPGDGTRADWSTVVFAVDRFVFEVWVARSTVSADPDAEVPGNCDGAASLGRTLGARLEGIGFLPTTTTTTTAPPAAASPPPPATTVPDTDPPAAPDTAPAGDAPPTTGTAAAGS